LAGLELGRRLFAEAADPDARLTTSRQVFDLILPRVLGADREMFFVVPVDVKNRLLEIVEVGRGSSEGVVFSPSEVLQAVLRTSASGFICAHNHPSGDVTPSGEDRALTRRLMEGARLVGVRFLDHVIVGGQTHYSFADAGWPA